MLNGRREDPPEEVVERFGFDPRNIGNRYRNWWVLDESRDTVYGMELEEGLLAVCARDGASNPPDMTAGQHPNFVGTEQDLGDRTYRYYYFKPLEDVDE